MSTLRKNTIANFLGQGWSAILGLALVPVYLHFLGVEAYGLVGFFVSLQAVLGIMDMGLSTTANREIARGAGESRRLVRTLEYVYGAVAVVLAAALILLSDWIATRWINSREIPPGTIRLAVVLFGVTVAIRWPVALYTGALRGLEKQVLLNWLTAGFATAKAVGAVIILVAISRTITAFLWWMLAAGILEVGLMAVVTWKVLPAASGRPAAFDAALLRRIWRFTAEMTAISIFAVVLKQLDKILISKILPLEELGYYMTAAVATRGLLLFGTPIFNSVFPRFSALVAAKDTASLAEAYHTTSRLASFLVAPAAAAMIFFSYDVTMIWTGSEKVAAHAHLAMSVLAFAMLLNGMMHVPNALQLAAGLTWIPLWNNSLSAVLLAPFIYVLTRSYGVVGAACAWAAFNVVYYAVIPHILHRHVLPGHKGAWILKDTLPFVVLSGATFGAAWLMARQVPSQTLRVGLAVLAGLAYGALALIFYPAIRRAIWRRQPDPSAALQESQAGKGPEHPVDLA